MAVKVGVGGVQRELSSVRAGVSGVNRTLSSWQGCADGVNRELLDPRVYRMSISSAEGNTHGAIHDTPNTPKYAWGSYVGIPALVWTVSESEVGENGIDATFTCDFDETLVGSSVTVEYEAMGLPAGGDVVIETWDGQRQTVGEIFGIISITCPITKARNNPINVGTWTPAFPSSLSITFRVKNKYLEGV